MFMRNAKSSITNFGLNELSYVAQVIIGAERTGWIPLIISRLKKIIQTSIFILYARCHAHFNSSGQVLSL